MLKNNFLYYLSIVFAMNFTIQAQPFINHDARLTGEKSNIADLEAHYLQWQSTQDMNQVKGYKFYARWLEEQIQRSSSSGQWGDQRQLFEVANLVSDLKNENDKRTPGGWIPVGPLNIPSVPGDRLIHGMGRINTVAFHPTDAQTLWVGVAQGGLWKTTDGGEHWRPLTDNLPVIRISDIAVDPSNPDIIYVCVGDYAYLGTALSTDARKRNTHYGLGVYKTVDGGDSWSPTGLTYNQTVGDISLMRRVFVDPTNGDRLVAAGISGVHVSNDGGATWTKQLDEVMSDLEMDPNNPSILYASSQNVFRIGVGRPALWRSEDFGTTWNELNSGLEGQDIQRIELAIAPSTTGVVYALACKLDGGFQALYKTINDGDDWSLQSTSPNILHWYKGNGAGGQGTYDLSIMVDPFNADKIYAGGINMWGSEDGGMTWKRASFWLPDYGPSLHADHHQYKYNPVDQYFYACHDGGINRTKSIALYTQAELDASGFKFETQWEDLSGGMEISSFYRMDIGKLNNDLIAGAQDNSTFYRQDTQWLNVVLGDGMDCFFHPTDPTVSYTSTQGGRLVRIENRGMTSVSNLTGQFAFGEQAAWTTPFERDPFNSDGIYTAFENVWHSSDRGETWIQLTDIDVELNGADNLISSSLSIAPSDENRFYVSKRIFPTRNRNGEMWRTDDGGVSVVNITEGLPDSLFITATAVHDFNSDLVWTTFGGFADGLKVFRSDDAGDNWINISYGLPNIPVNAIEAVPGSLSNRIYIGTDVGVYFIDDDMADWELYSDELPNVIVTDLVIDSEKEQIYVSTFGRGIWMSDLALISANVSHEIIDFDIHVSPNPTKGQFILHLKSKDAVEINVLLVDVKGRNIVDEKIYLNQLLDRNYNLNLPSGLFFLKVSSAFGSNVQRIVIE